MRHPMLLGFGVATAVLIPAALSHVTAGKEQVARLVAPASHALAIDGHKIDVSVDRSVVDPGGRVRVKLHAGDLKAGARVTAEVLVMESRGMSNQRVDTPPRTLERTSVTLVGGRPDAELAFTLPGRRIPTIAGSEYGSYRILVVPPPVADRLEGLIAKARRNLGGEDYVTWWNAYEERRDDAGKLGEVARLDVHTRPQTPNIAVEVPDRIVAGAPVAVKVTVTNPSGKRLKTSVSLMTSHFQGSYSADAVEISESQVVELAPYGKQQVTFRVTASQAGTIGLYARNECYSRDDWHVCEKLDGGQLEAVDVDGPAVVANTAKR